MTLGEADREALRWWARVGAWRRHDSLVRALVARDVSVQEIAEARDVPAWMIDEVLRRASTELKRGRR